MLRQSLTYQYIFQQIDKEMAADAHFGDQQDPLLIDAKQPTERSKKISEGITF